jgi:electron transport complex protein RnfD
MLRVVLALLPALAAGIVLQGLRALLVTLVSVAAALVSEWLFSKVTRRPCTIIDGSAAVTGLLLAMTLPASVPYWVAAAGAAFAIVVVKGLCGGLGENIFNPALAARAMLMLVAPRHMVRFAAFGTELSLANDADIVSSATPLHHMQIPALPEERVLDLLLGRNGGTIGEVCALALIIGGVYLIASGVISWRIPTAYLGTVAVLTLIFSKGDNAVLWMMAQLLTGGVLLGAFFMATDYVTSPVTRGGQLLYGFGCGTLTVVFRYTGLYPEGVTYAVLLMNASVWLLERCTTPRVFGTKKGAVK